MVNSGKRKGENNLLRKAGAASLSQLQDCSCYPSDIRIKLGRVSVIECIERIPCNPCVDICPQGAITIKGSIDNLPELDEELCNGCGKCLAICPGQAIFLVGPGPEKGEALVAFPYEYEVLPQKGDIVDAVNRCGEVVSWGRVLRIDQNAENEGTVIIYLAVPEDNLHEVRGMQRS